MSSTGRRASPLLPAEKWGPPQASPRSTLPYCSRSTLPPDLPQGIAVESLLQGAGQGVVGGLGLQLVIEGQWPPRLFVLPWVVLLEPGVTIGKPERDHCGDGWFG